jgi:hypothetical protein
MEAILEVVVQLIDLDTGFILKGLLVVVDYVELVLIVLHQEPTVIDHISHVALEIEHDAANLFHNCINR